MALNALLENQFRNPEGNPLIWDTILLEKTVAEPKKPGRKPGKDYGKHACRTVPQDVAVTEEYETQLPLQCPHCESADLALIGPSDEQFQTEIECRTIRRGGGRRSAIWRRGRW